MVMRKGFNLIPLLLTLIILSGGCLPEPYLPGEDRGTLQLRIVRAESIQSDQPFFPLSQSGDLAKLEIILTNNELERKVKVEPYQEGQVITIDSIYPGTWKIEVKCYNSEGKWILYGEQTNSIEPGKTSLVEIYIGLAPGQLIVTMDVSVLLTLGHNISSGRFYVENPATDESSFFDLTLVGNELKNKEKILLPPETYNTFFSVPNKSNPIYESDPIVIDVFSGKTTEINLAANSNVIVGGIIDLPPATPENFILTSNGNRAELHWHPVNATDLDGYNIYRTNRKGVFVLIDQVMPGIHSYLDVISINDYYNNRIGYAVSSYDQRGNNSIWTDRKYLYLE